MTYRGIPDMEVHLFTWKELRDDLASADVTLTAADIARLEALINQQTVQGARYNAQGTSDVDTEAF